MNKGRLFLKINKYISIDLLIMDKRLEVLLKIWKIYDKMHILDDICTYFIIYLLYYLLYSIMQKNII